MRIGDFILFEKKPDQALAISQTAASTQARSSYSTRFSFDINKPIMQLSGEFIDRLRGILPCIDLVPSIYNSLIGTFDFETFGNKSAEDYLKDLYSNVVVNNVSKSWPVFQNQLVDSAIAKGGAAGEAVPLANLKGWHHLTNINTNTLRFKTVDDKPVLGQVDLMGQVKVFEKPEYIYYMAPDLREGFPQGFSIYHGMPWMTQILERLYQCINNATWRVGDPSFLITVTGAESKNPKAMALMARNAAENVQTQLGKVMKLKHGGKTGDVITGLPYGGNLDVSIIGEGGEKMVTALSTPIAEVMKQIIGGSRLPDWAFSQNYGRTESLSDNQADLLAEGVKGYRSNIDPFANRFFGEGLAMVGMTGIKWERVWREISFRDQKSQAETRKANAFASKTELEVLLAKMEAGLMSRQDVETELDRKFTEREWYDIEKELSLNRTIKAVLK